MSSKGKASFNAKPSTSSRAGGLTLSDLPTGCSAVITTVDECVAELSDLGFLPGSPVIPTYSGLGGDPRVYELDGSPVALRRASAQHIAVRVQDQAGKNAD